MKVSCSFLTIFCSLLLLALTLTSFSPAYGAESIRSKWSQIQHVPASVVHIETRTAVPANQTDKIRQIEEMGSGVIVQINGKFFVLTNRHIIANATQDSIRLFLADHRVLRPIEVLTSPEFDIALLQISADSLVPAPIGNSDLVEIADPVFVFGSPFGMKGSLSTGIISAKGRRKIPQGDQPVPIQGFFQTDASVNPGNSGGPLVNDSGEVIGIVTAIASSSGGNEGVAFAIPINSMMKNARELVEKGRVIRPFLGVELDPKFSWEKGEEAGLDRNIGTRIEKVTPNSPGAKAGLQTGDIIVAYNDTTVEDDLHLVLLIAQSTIGEEATLRFYRNGTARTTKFHLEERP
ncbi:MAG: S1C family serine protease [Thermoguttaceae bacterium]